MSLENNNEENNIEHIRPTPIVTNLRRIIRKCSYCKSTNHIINSCDAYSLTIFEQLCTSKKNIFISMDSPSYLFASWLSFYVIEYSCYSMVRAFAVSRCGVRLRTHMNICIEKVTNYIFGILDDVENANYIQLPRSDHVPRHLNDSITTEWIMNLGFSLSVIAEINTHIGIGYQNQNQTYNESFHDKYNVYVRETERTETTENTNAVEVEDNCCRICYESTEPTHFVKLNCGHEFCEKCTKKLCTQDKYSYARCAYCRTTITDIECVNENIKLFISEVDETNHLV